MKEKFVKVKESLNEALELLKTEKHDEAIESFSKAFQELEALETEAVTTSEELAKTKTVSEGEKTELAKIKEEMKKRADMYISAENVTKLLEDLRIWITESIKQDMTKMEDTFSSTIEELKKTSLGSKQMTKSVWEDKKWWLFDSLMPD